MTKCILIPLPSTDFDPTECAVPWQLLSENGIKIQFATPDGKVAQCDQRMINGDGLGLFSSSLIADTNGRDAYASLEQSEEFNHPIKWTDINESQFDGLLLPGGHAPGMKEYLESDILQKTVVKFFASKKPVGAICHGVLLAARSKVESRSVLFGRKTTALQGRQELLAWLLSWLWRRNYYRTYPQLLESEVRSLLQFSDDFIGGPLPKSRDSADQLTHGFTVQDGNYLSARWPGDAHKFAADYLRMLGSV